MTWLPFKDNKKFRCPLCGHLVTSYVDDEGYLHEQCKKCKEHLGCCTDNPKMIEVIKK